MSILLLSNYYNHHMKALCREFDNYDKFSFYCTSVISQERIKLGYGESVIPNYVKKITTRKISVPNCSIIISTPHGEEFLPKKEKGEIRFRYSERPFKNNQAKIILLLKSLWINYKFKKHKMDYLLFCSAFACFDYSLQKFLPVQAYKWGYFPECKKYNVDELLAQKTDNSIIWCGRFIDWKHPELVIKVADMLKKDDIQFTVTYIGTGPMEPILKEMVRTYELDNCIRFVGSKTPDEVRTYMEQSAISLVTSNKKEGWGAVVNESMNSGCIVVASDAIGSVPFMISHEKNGLVFKADDLESLYNETKKALLDKALQKKCGAEAYYTIANEWNAQVAAKRLIKLSEAIGKGEMYPDIYATGPCSRCIEYKENWFEIGGE